MGFPYSCLDVSLIFPIFLVIFIIYLVNKFNIILLLTLPMSGPIWLNMGGGFRVNSRKVPDSPNAIM